MNQPFSRTSAERSSLCSDDIMRTDFTARCSASGFHLPDVLHFLSGIQAAKAENDANDPPSSNRPAIGKHPEAVDHRPRLADFLDPCTPLYARERAYRVPCATA
ncbi:MAG TPA: hypothetical protein DDW52_20605 [Planctomycetaceae bacterium]|nr:hypothetical protein [Planctomycetaceae bacterium]